jgi:penicillin amidase
MKYIKFIFTVVLSSIVLYYGNNTLQVGNLSIPSIAKFLDPISGFWKNAENASTYSDETLIIEGITSEVEIVYDSRKVAHIFAENIEDALFAQGYVEAQDRLWQMDFGSKSGAGRISEVVGASALNYDKERRRLGIPKAAKRAAEGWKKFPVEYAMLENYAHGVNEYINSLQPGEYPLEFKLSSYSPEQWSPYKSALIAKSMAYILCSREDDMESSNMLNYLGRETFDFLYPEINPKQAAIIPAEKKWSFSHELADPDSLSKSIDNIIYHNHLEKPEKGIGSNNWAVSGDKSASGNPLLCNDPHLGLSLPSVWMEIHIHTPEFSAYGASIPGIPGIMSGFNENVAWGVTNVGQDLLDWYKIEWSNEEHTEYYLDGKVEKVEFQIEEIKLKSGEVVYDTIKNTFWGPIVYENAVKKPHDLAMRWIAHDAPDRSELSTFVNLMRAKNYTDYDQALAPYISPAQNFAFASNEGDIAIIVNGKFPEKVKEEGRFVRKGNQSKFEWDTYIERDEIPRIKNPIRGFVASANQHSAAPDYPHYYDGSFEDYRSRSIRDILSEAENMDADFMKKMQFNSYSVKAQDVLPLMLNVVGERGELSDKQRNLFNILANWDYHYKGTEKAPTLFELWFNKMYWTCWDEFVALKDSFDVLYPESWKTIALIESEPDHLYFDIQETKNIRENARDIIWSSFENAIEEFDKLELRNESEWSVYRPVNIYHLSRLKEFSVFDIRTDGHSNTINANKGTFGPSWRMIVELGDKVKAYGVYPGGQSGNPGSPYYSNMIDSWAKGEYYEIDFIQSPDELGNKALYKQKLQPGER